ncbi:MAG: bifunctional 5,10-methylenetetrahydrofolate dehydrogenase/5,10-methenyltetrahydrofolate cyclohydrolase [Candidatus Lokiarchaeota archaeon]|nr:bifunctional 5,10-methylenetetrahydrofolate dehydrogenase/5,10-methenyltetrahydrofolate cyclohydrolase [Candidatus Lokiarchaeota archaeon]
MGKILNGKELANKLNLELEKKILLISKKTGVKPKLVGILVGNDPASELYLNIKRRKCAEIGIDSILVNLKQDITKEALIIEIEKLNADNTVHGIILQQPLPKKLKPFTKDFNEIINPLKDVDGLHPINRGKLFDYVEDLVPCTPKGIIALLEYYNIEIKGKHAVIINRSNLVGKPLFFMLLKRNATVSICHTSTVNLNDFIKNADILVTAVGQPNFITKEKIKEGVVIIDVGISKENGKTCGDVDYQGVFDKCSWITPNPGGVGPMTVSFLLQNTFFTYKNHFKMQLS